jgi:peptidoglycan LD-endopeptidase CwlK
LASRDLNLLHPALREKCTAFMTACLLAGLHPLITCTGRTKQEQEALYAQGRHPLPFVNTLRQAAGLYLLEAEAENRKVTWTKNTKHLILADGFCRAFDFCLVKDKRAYWDIKVSVNNNRVPDYEEAGLIALEVGLEWGGRWKTPDYPHCQLDV